MTREDDRALEIKERVDMAKAWGADVFVSIHINSSSSSSAQGAEVWYPNPNYNPSVYEPGKQLSESILKRLVELGLADRGVNVRTCVEDKYADGSLQDYYGVIRYSKLAGFPGIIVEHAFISNSSDANKMKDDSFLKKMGEADALGIANYFGLYKGEWVQDNIGWWFKYPDGSYPASQWLRLDEIGIILEAMDIGKQDLLQ